jgi:hypothetical protein
MQTTATIAAIPPARERAAAIRQARQDAFVVLPDVARMTGFGIAQLIQIEAGRTDVSSEAYEKISGAIDELLSEREHKYTAGRAK